MNSMRFFMLVLPILTSSSVSAETIKFEDAAAVLGTSCAKDIDASCRGVNFDSTRLKDCLTRNEDTMSAQCKADMRERSTRFKNVSPPAPPSPRFAAAT
jgi:hypothetical protein